MIGEAELDAKKLINWIGGETGYASANILLNNKVPIAIQRNEDHEVVRARFDHVWVRIFNMFGLDRWTLFSPSYKQYIYIQKNQI